MHDIKKKQRRTHMYSLSCKYGKRTSKHTSNNT